MSPKSNNTEEPLPPEEWDFRMIRDRELDAAILYEYGRSSDWVRGLFKKWHSERFETTTEALREWAGLSIGEIFDRTRKGTRAPVELCSWVSESQPEEFDLPRVRALSRVSLDFPQLPFVNARIVEVDHVDLRQSDPANNPVLPPHSNRPYRAFWDIDDPISIMVRALNPPQRRFVREGEEEKDEDTSSALRTFRIAVDLRFSKTTIKEQMSEWVASLEDSSVSKLKMRSGKAAAPPWHRLKELAAYRLAKAGQGAKGARALASALQKNSPVTDAPDVLPTYMPSGFTEAVQSAEKYRETLFPPPSQASPIG